MEKSLKAWGTMTRETLEDIRTDIWRIQAITKAAYNALDYRACAGETPSLKEQGEIMQLLAVAVEYANRAEAILNSYI